MTMMIEEDVHIATSIAKDYEMSSEPKENLRDELTLERLLEQKINLCVEGLKKTLTRKRAPSIVKTQDARFFERWRNLAHSSYQCCQREGRPGFIVLKPAARLSE